MRGLLLAILGLVALVAAAVLLVPRFVDQKLIERLALALVEERLGRPVEVRGPIELQFLPQPRLVVATVALGQRAGAPPSSIDVAFDRIDLDLAPLPLLRGQVLVRHGRVVRPTVRLRATGLARDGIARLARLLHHELPVDTLSVIDGRALIEFDVGTVEIEHIDLEAARVEGTGTISAAASGRSDGRPVRLEVETGTGGAGVVPLRFQLSLGSGPSQAKLSFRGSVDGRSAAGRAEGDLELASTMSELGSALAKAGISNSALGLLPDVAFGAAGRLILAAQTATLADLRVATDVGQLTGELGLQRDGPLPRLDLTLEASLLELGGQPWRPRMLWPAVPSDLAVGVQLRADAIKRGENTLRQLRLDLEAPGDGTLRLNRLSADLPGQGDVQLRGNQRRDVSGDLWQGELSITSGEPAALLDFLDQADRPALLARPPAVSLTARGTLRPALLTVDQADLRLGGSRISGRGNLQLDGRPRIETFAHFDRLSLDHHLVAEEILAALDDPRLRAFDAEVTVDLDRLGMGSMLLERARLALRLRDEALTVVELRGAEPGGIDLQSSGSWRLADRGFNLVLNASAPTADRLASAIGVTHPLLLGLEGQARFQLSASRGNDTGALQANLQVGSLSMQLDGTPRATGIPWPEKGEVRLTAPAIPELLLRLGLPAPPPQTIKGDASIDLAFKPVPQGWQAHVRGGVAGPGLDGNLTLEREGDRRKLAGQISATGLPTALMPWLWQLAERPLGLLPIPTAWPGAWPMRALDWRGPPFDLDLDLNLQLTGDGPLRGLAGLHLRSRERSVVVSGIDLPLADGRLRGEVMTLDGAEGPAMGLDLAISGSRLDLLATDVIADKPGVAGLLDLRLRGDSAGRSVAEMIGNLDGTVDLLWRDAELTALGGNPVTTQGKLRLDRGILRSDGQMLELANDQGRAAIALDIDLAAWIAEIGLQLTDPQGKGRSLRLLGPIGRPRLVEDTPIGP